MDEDCSRLEYWSGEIEKLEELNCKWGEKAHNAMEIKNLCIGIGSDKELLNEEFIFLQDQLKKSLKCPKSVSVDLIDKSRLIANPPPPPPPIPEDCIKATLRPIDLQAAEIILREKDDLITEKAWALFRYYEELGYWLQWVDTKAKNTAQEVLQRLGKLVEEDGWIFPYGTFSQVESTIKQLKVLTTGGVLGNSTPAQVIVFKNGTFNLTTNELEQHSPSNGATYGVAADYIKDSGCPPELKATIEKCYPPGALPIVQAIIRWLVDPTARYGQAFHIVGDSGTGKGLLIDFCRSLFPSSVTGQLLHPADLHCPEKIHQYVLGRRLLVFPDTPSALERRDGDTINLFYELVENKPVTIRKLFAGESEESQPMHCRFILGSIQALELRNGRSGYLRRTLMLHTLPRQGEPDHSLFEQLNPKCNRFDAIRAEAISWALTMSQDELNNVLDGNDPEGLLRDSAKDMAASSDALSRWADECLTVAVSANDPVAAFDWALMFECYLGWCDYNNTRYKMQRHDFVDSMRRVLGPKRCLSRTRESAAIAKSQNRGRDNLPPFDAGFRLRPGIIAQSKDALAQCKSEDFRPQGIETGGLQLIAELAQAARPAPSPEEQEPCSVAKEPCSEAAQGLLNGCGNAENSRSATDISDCGGLAQGKSGPVEFIEVNFLDKKIKKINPQHV